MKRIPYRRNGSSNHATATHLIWKRGASEDALIGGRIKTLVTVSRVSKRQQWIRQSAMAFETDSLAGVISGEAIRRDMMRLVADLTVARCFAILVDRSGSSCSFLCSRCQVGRLQEAGSLIACKLYRGRALGRARDARKATPKKQEETGSTDRNLHILLSCVDFRGDSLANNSRNLLAHLVGIAWLERLPC